MDADAQTMLDDLIQGVNHVIQQYVTSSRGNTEYREQKRPIVLGKLNDALRSMSAIDRAATDDAMRQRIAVQRHRLQQVICMIERQGQPKPDYAHIQSVPAIIAEIRVENKPPRHRRHVIIGTFIAIAVICGCLWVYKAFGDAGSIRDIEHSNDLDAIEANIVANAGNNRGNDAVKRYIHVADSLLNSPDYNPVTDNLLMRADNLAKQLKSQPEQSAMVEQWVETNVNTMYQLCLSLDDLDSWRSYMYSVPQAYIYDSGARVDSLEQVAWSSEPTAWIEAAATNTHDSYQRYIDTYPNGEHIENATGSIIDMEVRAYRNRGNGIIEKIDSVGPYDGQQSLIAIFNDTDYPMEWLFSGPTSRRMVVPPSNNAQIELGNGYYCILVLVDDSRRDRFSFNQTFSSGIYSSSIGME